MNVTEIPPEDKKYTSNYTILELDDDMYLLFSSNMTDQLPIVRTELGAQPCLNSNSRETGKRDSLYVLEAEKQEEPQTCKGIE